MTHSGELFIALEEAQNKVLIPLLLDDPLWALIFNLYNFTIMVLIPLLLDDPLWDR